MPTWIRGALTQAASLGAAGLLVGLITAWAALLSADGAPAVAAGVALGHWPLLLALPATLLVMNWGGPATPGPQPAVLASAGLVGGLLGHGVFLVTCTNVPAIFGGEDVVALAAALATALGGRGWLLATAAGLLGALLAWGRLGMLRGGHGPR